MSFPLTPIMKFKVGTTHPDSMPTSLDPDVSESGGKDLC